MSRRPKDIGTATTTAAIRHCISHYWPHAELRNQRGTLDAGDVTGTPGVCWEMKGGDAAKNASDGQILAWLEETEKERRNAGADIGVLVVQRRGIGAPNAGRWWAIVWTSTILGLHNRRILPWHDSPVRLYLDDMCQILVAAGYGTKPENGAA